VTISAYGSSESLRQTGLFDGGVSNSRFGLKGSEDLGGGLKAVFTLEQGFSLDTGAAGTVPARGSWIDEEEYVPGSASGAFSREATVGLQGNFGTVKLGKQYNAFDDVSGAAASVFDSDLAPINTVFLSTAAATNRPTPSSTSARPSAASAARSATRSARTRLLTRALASSLP
jgi:predicted porin